MTHARESVRACGIVSIRSEYSRGPALDGRRTTPARVTVKKLGRVDIMVNNAGVETRTSVLEEIASVVAFLAGDGASYMTATTLVVDGGMMQQSPGL